MQIKKIDNGLVGEVEEKHFTSFEGIATTLIKLVDEINLHVEGIKEAQQEIRRKFWRNIIITTILSSLIIGFILLSIEYKFFVPKQTESNNPTKTEQKIP